MQPFQNLRVWQGAHALTLDVYRSTREFPSDERFGLTSQLRRAASSVGANLAEGCSRGSDRDFGRFVQIAIGSVSEVENHLLLARDLGYLDRGNADRFIQRADVLRRQLIALLHRLRRSPRSEPA